MRMEQYLTHTDYALWEVIVNGDAPAVTTSVSGGADAAIPPKTTEQKIARRNELKAKSTLLLAIPDEHLLKFHGIKDAKTFQLEIHGEVISQEDANLKLLRNLEQIDTDDLEVMDLKWKVAIVTMRVKIFIKKTRRNLNFNGKETIGFDKTKVECYNCHRRGHFAKECRAPRSQDKTGLGYDSQLNERDLNNKSDVFESASDSSVNESEEDNNQTNDRYKAGKGYHAVPPPYTGNFMPPRPDLCFAGVDDSIFKSAIREIVTSVHETETSTSKTSKESIEKPKTIRSSAPIIEDWESNSDDDCEIRPLIEQNKPSHAKINGKATSQRELRPVWNNAKRVNHQNFSNNITHPHPRRNFVPTAVITNSSKVPVNVAKQSSPRAATSTSTARYVNTTANRPTVNGKHSDLKEKINTAGTKAVVSVVQGNRENDVKSSACWIWRPNGNVIDHISKDSGSYMLKRFNYGNPQYTLKDQGIFDSGCSRHMPRNKSFLTDSQEIDEGFVIFGGSCKNKIQA
nr:ribonuclease H-like domain-containing protein [Tanacetum cinerariifolium]